VMVHGHVWRTVCSVCATGARVAQPVPCNSLFVVPVIEVSPAPSHNNIKASMDKFYSS